MNERRAAPLVFVLFVATASACGGPARDDGNLLAGKVPVRAEGVMRPETITDGRAAHDGDDWGTPAGATLGSDAAYVEYDLGRSVPIRAGYVQGDNNDVYLISISDDGKTFRELWAAGPVTSPGLRPRTSDSLQGSGRWVRLSARGGDGLFAVSELQLWSERPAVFPPRLTRMSAASRGAQVRTALLYLVAAFMVALAITGAASGSGRVAAAALLPAAALWFLYQAVGDAWPLGAREISFARAAAAGIALAALARAVTRRGGAPHRPLVTGACAVAALLAVASLYNFGRPQFWNASQRGPEFVHVPDMRIYQPFAKYFHELRYDGVYAASVLAYAEDERGGSLATLADTTVRDLRDHRSSRVGDLVPHITAVRQRFTNERWAEFKGDIAYFRSAMGPEFITSLTDHGANATPVWVWLARLLLAHAPASEATLVVGGLIDAVLLLIMAIAIARTFGVVPMLVAMTVFGANDLYMFGTNWTGATLRHDWIVALGLAACALERRRWTVAGVLIGLAAMIRFFPVIALVGVGIPAAAAAVERWMATRRAPDLKALLREHDGATRTIAAALATMLATFLLTGVLYSFGVWGEWWHKVSLLNRDTAINEVSLRALVAGTDSLVNQLLTARLAIYLALAFVCVGTVVLAARRRPLHEAMVLALPLVLVFSNPSNYHLHLVFLLVLVGVPAQVTAVAASWVGLAVPWLAMCVASYWTGLDPDTERHFQILNALLFVTLGWYYARVLRAEAAPAASHPAPA